MSIIVPSNHTRIGAYIEINYRTYYNRTTFCSTNYDILQLVMEGTNFVLFVSGNSS